MAIRVLFVSNISRAPLTSVADRMLIRGLAEKGVEITVITPYKSEETEELKNRGITVRYIEFRRKVSIRAAGDIRQLLKDNRFDIMHITYSKAVTNCLIAAIGIDIKIVGYYGSLSLHWHDPSSWTAFLNPRIDTIICPSDAVVSHVRKQLPRKRRNRVVRIYRGYDPLWFEGLVPADRKTIGVSDDEFLICSVGNLRKVKGVRYLIDSVRYIPSRIPVRILLIGGGTDSASTRRLAADTGFPERFIHLGHSNLPAEWMAASDLYVQPSLSEGLGRAISEAMCLAKPVIVTDGGGAKEFFAGGDNGFVVRKGSATALADAITGCWEKGRESLMATGEKARESMYGIFNNRHTVEMTLQVYKSLAI